MQISIYKITPRKNRRGFEVDFDVVWSKNSGGKEKLNQIENPKDESMNKALSGCLSNYRESYGSFKQHWLSCHC